MVDDFPLRLLLATAGGCVNRHQAQAIEYLAEENFVLRGQLGNKRLRLTDGQRRRLAAKTKPLGRRLLDKAATIVTILRWHHRLIAAHPPPHPHKNRTGRPDPMKSSRELIVRLATDNGSYGYLRIQGGMQKVGHTVARTTIANTLKDNGIAPSSDRPTTSRTLLKSQTGSPPPTSSRSTYGRSAGSSRTTCSS